MKNKKVVIIIVIIVLAVVGYFGYNILFKTPNAQAAPSETSAPKLESLLSYSTGDAYVTNVKESKALCKLSVSFAYSGGDKAEFLKNNNALIRSSILEVVRNHTEAELRSPDAPQTLAKEMVTVLNKNLEVDTIVNAYISDYVVQ